MSISAIADLALLLLLMKDERDRVFDEKVVAADMLDFMSEFRVAHPSYFEAPLYVTGESYGGHYVPAVTYGLFQYNKVRMRNV